jgi:bifunctional UDP-N-acetylglucosamine pyrophosphorylase / glucosamine-1-phosphate N-acetyltransferase
MESSDTTLYQLVKELSSNFNTTHKNTAIILAAGHGKRIKSNTSKMLHKIWEVPTVNRVCNALQKGLNASNTIVVVGIKAEDVIKSVGKQNDLSFAYQEVQHGTGHAVQIALQNIPPDYQGTVFVFPGDMGLVDVNTVKFFKDEFEISNADMMVLTGIFEDQIEDNYYGRIVRVPEKDVKGVKSKEKGKVIEIIEFKDIMNLDNKKPYMANYKKKTYKISKKELINNREFNSSVYAFKFKPLAELINKIESNNAQSEIYLTDLIDLFNKHGYSVEAISPQEQYVLMGFNNKSVLKEMDSIARNLIYEKLKDVVLIDDPNDFFIAENVAEDLVNRDKNGEILDIEIGKGVYIGNGVKLNHNINLMRNVRLVGNVEIGKNVTVGMNSEISGSNEFPMVIGSDVSIKGQCYIFGSYIGEGSNIEHSIIIKKKIRENSNVKFVLPVHEGEQ